MQRGKTILSLFSLGALACPAVAQEVRPLLSQGQTVIGMGGFTDSAYVFVNDARTWVSVIDTTFGDETRDGALLRNWLVTYREGAQLYEPDLTFIDEFDPMDMTPSGDLAMLIKVGSVPLGSRDVLYWNSFQVFNDSDFITGPGIGAESRWLSLATVKANSNRQVLVVGEIGNTAVTGAREDIIALLQLGPQGQIESNTILATKGMVMPVLDGLPMVSTDKGPHAVGLNKHGEWIAPLKASGININYIVKNGTQELAREGGPSPIPNRNWRSNAFSLVFRSAINDFGDVLYTGAAEVLGDPSAAIYAIVKNDELFVREGNILPEFSPNPVGKGSASPLLISNSGDVYWYCQDNGSAEAFMRNYTPIINEGITRVNGNLVTNIERTQHGFNASADGRFWIGRVEAQLVGKMIVFADFGLVLPVPGCAGNPGKLSLVEGKPFPGDHLVLGMDNGQAPGVQPILQLSTQARIPGSDCGVVNSFGEILFSPAHRIAKVFLPTWNGTSPSTIDLNIPDDVGLVDATFYAQGVFWDSGGVSSEPVFRLTNALKIEIGAP